MPKTALKIADAVSPLYIAGGGRGLGLAKLDNPSTAEEMLEQAGLNWTVSQHPVMLEDGQKVPGYVANVRDDTGAPLAVVKDTFTPVQNVDAFGFADEILANGEASFIAANERRGGAEVNAIMMLSEKLTLGKDEEILPLLTLHNGFNGWIGLSVSPTPFRLACINGMLVRLKDASASWKTNHTLNVADRLQAALTAIAFAKEYYAGLGRVGADLLRQRFTKEQFKRFAETLVPLPEGKDETEGGRAITNVLEKRALLQAIRDTSGDLDNIRSTKWGAFQAVTQYVRDLPAKQTKRFSPEELRYGRQFEKHPLTQAAFDLLTGEIDD